jgi:hypothetical protein
LPLPSRDSPPSRSPEFHTSGTARRLPPAPARAKKPTLLGRRHETGCWRERGSPRLASYCPRRAGPSTDSWSSLHAPRSRAAKLPSRRPGPRPIGTDGTSTGRPTVRQRRKPNSGGTRAVLASVLIRGNQAVPWWSCWSPPRTGRATTRLRSVQGVPLVRMARRLASRSPGAGDNRSVVSESIALKFAPPQDRIRAKSRSESLQR